MTKITATVNKRPRGRPRKTLARPSKDDLRKDPILFAEHILGVTFWERQREVCAALRDHSRVAVRSGHKVGKSRVAAAIALWWAVGRPGARVVMTSASSRQVRSILWREIKSLYLSSLVDLGGELREDPNSGLKWPDGSEILGFSTDQPERMAGLSGEHLLFIIDEASGVPESIFEAIEGNRAGGAKILMLSNPTRLGGTFYDAFHTKRDLYKTIHISAEETPNATGKKPIPGLATAEWLEEKKEEWGEESALYQVRARGNFPRIDDSTIISLDLVEDAQERWESIIGEGPLSCGLDPARFGDDEAVLSLVRGQWASEFKVYRSLDSIQLAGRVIAAITDENPKRELVILRVDSIGIGAGVFDQLLSAAPSWLTVISVQVSERAYSPSYFRLRDQLWFGLRDWLRGGGAIPPDPKLEVELTTPRYSFNAQNLILVESKDEMKRTIRRSPDRADALALAVCGIGSVASLETVRRSNQAASKSSLSRPPRKRGSWSTW